jgi:hypothetical protein
MTVRGNNIHCSNECMETELQGCYILHVCAKELLAESDRAISATVPHGHGLRQRSFEHDTSNNAYAPYCTNIWAILTRIGEHFRIVLLNQGCFQQQHLSATNHNKVSH